MFAPHAAQAVGIILMAVAAWSLPVLVFIASVCLINRGGAR